MNFVKILDGQWIMDKTRVGCVDSWVLWGLHPRMKLAWNMISRVVLWSLWKERKSRIFQGKSLDVRDLFQVAKWRLCVWLISSTEFKGLQPYLLLAWV